MALNDARYRELLNLGLPHAVALRLADPAQDTISGTAVADPAALTAPADIAATYTEAEVQALRNDVAALRTTVANLLASLRSAGVIEP